MTVADPAAGLGGGKKHEIYGAAFGGHHFYRLQRSWGKVIFSEACVNNSVHGGGRAWLPGGMHGFIWGVCVVLFGGACMVLFEGACVVLFGGGGHAWFYLGGHAWFYLVGGHVWFYSVGGHAWFY